MYCQMRTGVSTSGKRVDGNSMAAGTVMGGGQYEQTDWKP